MIFSVFYYSYLKIANQSIIHRWVWNAVPNSAIQLSKAVLAGVYEGTHWTKSFAPISVVWAYFFVQLCIGFGVSVSICFSFGLNGGRFFGSISSSAYVARQGCHKLLSSRDHMPKDPWGDSATHRLPIMVAAGLDDHTASPWTVSGPKFNPIVFHNDI